LGGNSPEDERCFAAVARLSEVTNGLYRIAGQPVVRALATEQGAEWMRRLHPLRLSYELLSDRNPAIQPLAAAAEKVKKNRQPVATDNPYLHWEMIFSDWMTMSLDLFGQWRDMLTEHVFFSVYGQSWLQALLGLPTSDAPVRSHPGQDPEHMAFVRRRIDELRAQTGEGGPREAAIRALLYIRMPEKAADERGFEMLRRIRSAHCSRMTLAEFKQKVREQYFMLRLDESRAVALIPDLLKGHEEQGPQLFDTVRKIATAPGDLDEEGRRRLARLEPMFAAPEPQ
jgi:hypothetical protein